MKRLLIMCLLALCLTALPTTAGALEYSVEALDGGLFGRPTSDDTTYLNQESANQDRSKNSALIAPGFGSPTSYLPSSGEALTPNLIATSGGVISGGTGNAAAGAVGGWTVMSSGMADTASVIPPAQTTPPSQTASPDFSVSYPTYNTAFTAVTSDLYYAGGYLGTLKIPDIGLTVKVYEGTGSSPLSKGAGHFEDTSIWNGNVALAGHNRGVTNHFGQIHTLEIGDKITLSTKLGTRSYAVTSVAQVGETDRASLAATSDNRVTLYTCVRDVRDMRWCVQAREIS